MAPKIIRKSLPSCWHLSSSARDPDDFDDPDLLQASAALAPSDLQVPEWVAPDGRKVRLEGAAPCPSVAWSMEEASAHDPGRSHVWVGDDDHLADPVVLELRIATLSQGLVDLRPRLAGRPSAEIQAFFDRPQDLLERQGDILAALVTLRAPAVVRAQRNLRFWAPRRRATLNLAFGEVGPEAVRAAVTELRDRLDFVQALQGLAA